MKKLFSLILIFIASSTIQAQHSLGLKGNAGISYLTTRIKDPDRITQKFSFLPSLQVGLFYSYQLTQKVSLGTELLWIPIEGKEKRTSANLDENGHFTGNYSHSTLYRDISYLGIPLYVGYTYKRWNFNLGVQMNYHLRSSSSENGYGVDLTGQAVEWEFDGGQLNIDQFNIGIRPGCFYQLSDRVQFELNYFGGLNNIIDSPNLTDIWNWKVQQLTAGLRLSVGWNKTKIESAPK